MHGALLIVFCSALWATDTIFRLPLAKTLDSLTIVLFQQVLCVIATFPLFFARRGETRELKLPGWASVAFVGIMGEALGTYLFTSSFRHINPSVAILLQKTQPVVAVLAARLILKERAPRQFYIWACVAVLASTMVSLPDLWSFGQLTQGFPALRSDPMGRGLGIAQALAASFVWGLSTVFGKWITTKVSFPVTSFLRFAWGLTGIVLITLTQVGVSAQPLGQQLSAALSDPFAIKAILYVALIPGVLAMYLYYAGLKTTRASSATFAELFFPVAAVTINWVLLDQGLNPTQIAGAVVLLAAVFFINQSKKGRA